MITDRSKELLGMDEKFTCMISQQLQISSARTDFVHGSNMFCKIHLPGNCRHFFLFSCFTSEASRIASGAFRFRLKKFAFTDVKLQISPLVPEIVLNPWYIFLWMTKYWTTIWPSIKCRFRQFGSFLHCVEHGCCAGTMVHAFAQISHSKSLILILKIAMMTWETQAAICQFTFAWSIVAVVGWTML